MPNLLTATVMQGITEGVIGLVLAHPFDTVKTRLQTVGQIHFGGGEFLYTGGIDCFRKILKREGILSLYKGIGLCLACVMPTNLMMFGIYDLLIHSYGSMYAPNNGEIDEKHIFIAGISGVIPATVLTTPLERIKLRLQVPSGFFDYPSTPYWVVKDIVDREGIAGLWRGLSLTIMRDAQIASLTYISYSLLTKQYLKHQDDKNYHKKGVNDYIPFGICGGISGMIGWVWATPTDFVKTRFQTESKTYHLKDLEEFFKHIRDEAKFRNLPTYKYFYTGGILIFLRAFFQYAGMFIGYEVYRELTREKTLMELYEEEREEETVPYNPESEETDIAPDITETPDNDERNGENTVIEGEGEEKQVENQGSLTKEIIDKHFSILTRLIK